MRPLSTGSSRLTQRSSVLLPLPLGPITTSTSPEATSRSIPSRTRLSPKLLRTPSRRTTGSAEGSAAGSATAVLLPRKAGRVLGESGFARARLVELAGGCADDREHRSAEVEVLVEQRREPAAGERADPVDPPVGPQVLHELGAERSRRVHRRAGERSAHED